MFQKHHLTNRNNNASFGEKKKKSQQVFLLTSKFVQKSIKLTQGNPISFQLCLKGFPSAFQFLSE